VTAPAAPLAFRSIAEHHRALAAHEYSALELTEHFLERIERLSPSYNAYLTLDAEGARTAARAADAALRRGDARPLLGIPLALKDNFETAGLRTTAGSRVLEDYVPKADGFSVALLRRAGAVILGKTHLSEFAGGASVFGPMRNPWDTACTAGGSSGGTGSAVAAGLAAAGTGTDSGGSIRIPAAFCGLTGLKPTYGRVSLRGVIPASWSRDTVGPMTRSAEDAAALLNVLAEPDPADGTHCQRPAEDYGRLIGRPLTGLRVGRPRSRFFDEVEATLQGAVEAAVAVLEDAGCAIADVEIPTAKATLDIHVVIIGVETAAYHGRRLTDRALPYDESYRRRYLAGLLLPADALPLAQRAREQYRRGFRAAMERFDLLVTPTVRIPPPPAEGSATAPASILGDRPITDAIYSIAGFTAPFNLTGQPALTLPCGFTPSGLPVGLQLAGKPFQEALLLQVAAAYQACTDWHLRRPPLTDA
jgi:aspartyl-tRNA(Asn)/glutamyl-tRNA(Gln) amidotransferase subunit A